MMLNWDQTFIILLHIAQYCDKMIIHEKNYFSKFTHLPNFYLWELSFDILDFIPSICLQHKIKCFRGIKLTLFSMFLTSQCTPYCKTAHILFGKSIPTPLYYQNRDSPNSVQEVLS